jgi:hypothetical protein
MKKILYSLLIAAILVSCKEKDVDCSAAAYKNPCNIAFKEFQKAEVGSVVIKRYSRNTHFAQLESSDTGSFPDAKLYGDTAYANTKRASFSALSDQFDYELVLPATGRTYRVE